MHEDEIKKLQEESWTLEIKKSKKKEEMNKIDVRLQEINTRLLEVLRDNYKVQSAISNFDNMPQTLDGMKKSRS